MDGKDRENLNYSEGKRCQISTEETYMLDQLSALHEKSNRVLDIGCGSGEISLEMQNRGFELFGLDFSDVAIDIARKNGIESKVCDLDKGFPLENDSFDVVWAGDVMEHVFDPIFVMQETKRVLKKNGSFFATIPYDLNWKVRIKTLLGQSYQEGVYKHYGQFKHHSFFSEKLLRFMLLKAELELLSIKYVTGYNKKQITSSKFFRIFSHLMIIHARAVSK